MADNDPLVGVIIDSRYKLIESLGKGGMGSVMLAFDEDTNSKVALKLIQPEASGVIDEVSRKRMKREVKILMLVEDPRVVQLFDWGVDRQYGMYYTMELLDQSRSLKRFLQEEQPSLRLKLQLLNEVLYALHALHKLNVVHRDMKFGNVLVLNGPEGPYIKLIDPGIARWFNDDLRKTITVKTETGAVLGTPSYMSPEMWRGDPVDGRTDIYQMGIMCFHMLTGRLPFSGMPHQIMFKHLQDRLPSLHKAAAGFYPDTHIPVLERINTLLRKATAKDPELRYPTTLEFAQDIQRILEVADFSDLSTLRLNADSFIDEDPTANQQPILPTGKVSVETPEAFEQKHADTTSLATEPEATEKIHREPHPQAQSWSRHPLGIVFALTLGGFVLIVAYLGLTGQLGSSKSQAKQKHTENRRVIKVQVPTASRTVVIPKKLSKQPSPTLRPVKKRPVSRNLSTNKPIARTLPRRSAKTQKRNRKRRVKKRKKGLGRPGSLDLYE